MLKNLSPMMSGALLRALDDTPSGAWVAIVSPRHDVPRAVRVAPESVEQVVTAVLAVTPLDGDAPIVIEDGDGTDDIALAVAGLAADAEGRRLDTLPVSTAAFQALLSGSRAAIVVDSPERFGFLLCKGQC